MDENKFNELIKQANELLAGDDLKGALSYYLEAGKLQSESLIVLKNTADIYFKLGQAEEAEKICEQALEKYYADTDIHSMLGAIYHSRGKTNKAIGEFQEIIKLSPEKASFAYEALGDIFAKDNKKNEALSNYNNAAGGYHRGNLISKEMEIYNKILALDGENIKALLNLSETLVKLDKKNEAVDVFNNLIDVYQSHGMIDKAILIYEKIYELDKENKKVSEYLINIYKEILEKDPSNLSAANKLIAHIITEGKVDEAIPIFINLAKSYLDRNLIDDGINISDKVIEISPDNPYAYEVLGKLYLKAGKKEESLSAYAKAFELFRNKNKEKEADEISEILNKNFPDQSIIHYQLATSFFEKNDIKKATEEVQAALNNNPADEASLKLYMNILEGQNKTEDLIGVYQRILQLNPEDIVIREKLIEVYLNFGRIDDAVKESKYLGDVLCENKDYKTSEKIFRNILSFFPNDLDVRERIAYLLFQRNEIYKAKRELLNILNYDLKNDNFIHAIDICRKIIKIDPQDFNTYHILGSLALRADMIKEALSCYMLLADLYIINKMNYKAIEAITEVLRLSAKQTHYRAELVNILLMLEKTDQAKEQYKILIKDLIEEQNIEKAKNMAHKLIEISGDDYAIRRDLSILFIKNNIIGEALNILDNLTSNMEKEASFGKAIDIIDPILSLLFNRGYFEHFWALRKKKASWYDAAGDVKKSASERFEIITGMLKQNFTLEADSQITDFILYAVKNAQEEYFIKLLDFAGDLYKSNLFNILIPLLKPLADYYYEGKDYEKVLFIMDMLITSYLKINKKEEALLCYKKVVEIYYLLNDADNFVKSLFSVIELLIQMNKYEEIDEFYEKIVKTKDTYDVKTKMANIYFNIGNYEKTKFLLEKTILFDEHDKNTLILLAKSYIKLDIYDKTAEVIKKLVGMGASHEVISQYKDELKERVNPFNQNILLAKLYKDISFCEDALFLLFASDKMEYNFAVKKLIADYLKECGFMDIAVKQYKNILESSLNDDEYLDIKYELSLLFEQIGCLKEAIEGYQDALAIDIKYKDVAQKIKELNGKLRDI